MPARSHQTDIHRGLAAFRSLLVSLTRSRWLWVALAIVVGGIILLPLLLLAAGLSNFAAALSWFSGDLLKETALDPIPVRIASGFLALLTLAGLKFALSRKSGVRLRGIAVLVSVFVLYNAGLYALTRQTFFAPDSGQARKWYAATPEGVRFSDRSGVESQYGIPFKPVTPEILPALLRWHGGLATEVQVRDAKFFDPATGAAVVWYRVTASGSSRFFDGPGFDPTDGEPLLPVTREIAAQHQQALMQAAKQAESETAIEKDQASRSGILTLLNPGCFSGDSKESIAVAACEHGFAAESPYQTTLLQAINAHCLALPLFNSSAYAGGRVRDILSPARLSEFELVMQTAQTRKWLVATLAVDFQDQSSLQPGLVTANIQASFQSQGGSLTQTTSKGAGFGREAAVDAAIRNLVQENISLFNKEDPNNETTQSQFRTIRSAQFHAHTTIQQIDI